MLTCLWKAATRSCEPWKIQLLLCHCKLCFFISNWLMLKCQAVFLGCNTNLQSSSWPLKGSLNFPHTLQTNTNLRCLISYEFVWAWLTTLWCSLWGQNLTFSSFTPCKGDFRMLVVTAALSPHPHLSTSLWFDIQRTRIGETRILSKNIIESAAYPHVKMQSFLQFGWFFIPKTYGK